MAKMTKRAREARAKKIADRLSQILEAAEEFLSECRETYDEMSERQQEGDAGMALECFISMIEDGNADIESAYSTFQDLARD